MKGLIKKFAVFFFFLIFLNFIPISCSAMEIENNTQKILDEQYNNLEIDKIKQNIPQETQKDLESIGIDPNKPQDIKNFNITKIFEFIFSKSIT